MHQSTLAMLKEAAFLSLSTRHEIRYARELIHDLENDNVSSVDLYIKIYSEEYDADDESAMTSCLY